MTNENEDNVWQPENPTDFKVYDVPMELKNDYISMAKLHYDDDVWKVMADAMAALKEDKFTKVEMMEEKIMQLEEEIATIKTLIKNQSSEDDNDLKPTFGGGE